MTPIEINHQVKVTFKTKNLVQLITGEHLDLLSSDLAGKLVMATRWVFLRDKVKGQGDHSIQKACYYFKIALFCDMYIWLNLPCFPDHMFHHTVIEYVLQY